MSSGGWFRVYDEVLDDPKVQKLSGDDFKSWVNLLCLARRNNGVLPDLDSIAFALRMSVDGARTVLERLLNATLIDRRNGGADGAHYAPHGWEKRQYKSDGSTERVKRFRNRYKDVSETGPETETETETERKKRSNRSKAAAPLVFDGKVIHLNRPDFDCWRKAFPDLDLMAILQARDDWLDREADEGLRKRWFIPTSNYLANLQQKATAAKREPSYDRDRITV